MQNDGHSDHKIIHATRVARMIKGNTRYVIKRSYKQSFIEEVRRTSWWSVYCCEDANEAAEIFTNKLSEILDRHAPVKTFQTRSNFAPWLSEETKILMQDRDRAQIWASSSKRKEDWSSYRILRNKVTKNLMNEKINWRKKSWRTVAIYQENCGPI